MEVLIRGKGLEAKLHEIVNWWEVHFPHEVKAWKEEMLNLKTISKPVYKDAQGRETHVNFKVPTLLFMSCQHCIPDFGKDSDDIQLMTKVLRDFNGAADFKSRFGDFGCQPNSNDASKR